MSKKENHKQDLGNFFDEFLKTGDDRAIIEYLVSNSNLPGRRANLELPAVFAELIEDYFTKDPERLWNLCLKLIDISPDEAPVDNPKEFPSLCGACAIGASGSVSKAFFQKAFSYLEELANDSRWKIRGFLPRGPFIVILAASGFLFLICWLLSCRVVDKTQIK